MSCRAEVACGDDGRLSATNEKHSTTTFEICSSKQICFTLTNCIYVFAIMNFLCVQR